jgi:molybdopterin-synthase adenylyltransferase
MNERYSRQSFLGEAGQRAIELARVGVVGLGGGGSHIAPQAAHLGFQNFVLFDDDYGTESNLNRTMTLVDGDIALKTLKVDAARRRIVEINPKAVVECHNCRWQDNPEPLQKCDLVFGSGDSFTDRQQLEAFCRRYLIVYLDIGMDLHVASDGPPGMGGQVIVSMPNGPCMFCMGFLDDEKLGREANNYGAAGARPQVVWANGVLASTAVGLAVDIVTDWTRSVHGPIFLSYRGNDGTIVPHVRLPYVVAECPHYPSNQLGNPDFSTL